MRKRIQVLVTPAELERLRRRAGESGMSLSAWLREAGMEKLEREGQRRITDVEELRAFFRDCDARRSPEATEPDWQEHRETIRESRGRGLPDA